MSIRPGVMRGRRCLWKFPVVPSAEPIKLFAPSGAIPVALSEQNGSLVMWAEVETTAKDGWLYVMVVGTGWDYDADLWEYVATIQRGAFVWHLLRQRPR